MATERLTSFGQGYRLTLVDRFGLWLSRRQVTRFIDDMRDLRVADLGCGYEATLVRPWLDEVREAYLLDLKLSTGLKAHPKVRAIERTLPEAATEMPSESFDLVFLNSILEHLWEPEKVLAEVHRALVPGGTALINVPSWRGKFWLELSAFRLGLSPTEEMEDHKRYYDVRDLWPLLVRAGFLPSHIRCFSHKFGLNTFGMVTK